MLAISIGSISTTLLQSKLLQISLDSRGRRYGSFAVAQITFAALSYAKQNGLPFAFVPRLRIVDIIVPPVEGPARLPAEMRNVTVDATLDAVARAFQGVVTYGACTMPNGENRLDINFEPGA
jgi:hypothetical protein